MGRNWTTEEYREFLRTGREPAERPPVRLPRQGKTAGKESGLEDPEKLRSAYTTCCARSTRKGVELPDEIPGEFPDEFPEEAPDQFPEEAPDQFPEDRAQDWKSAGSGGPPGAGKASGGTAGAGKVVSMDSVIRTAEKRRNKYGNKVTYVNGKRFDSEHEAAVYQDLRLRVRAGELKCVIRQVRFDLADTENLQYVADFVTIAPDMTVRVLDAKSAATRMNRVYLIKKKLMREKWGIEIEEV